MEISGPHAAAFGCQNLDIILILSKSEHNGPMHFIVPISKMTQKYHQCLIYVIFLIDRLFYSWQIP